MLPELKDFHWYIDMKLIPAASGQRTQQPSCVLTLDIDQQPSVNLELSRETLNLVLENFARLREQLNTLAKRE